MIAKDWLEKDGRPVAIVMGTWVITEEPGQGEEGELRISIEGEGNYRRVTFTFHGEHTREVEPYLSVQRA